jgi:hypothetical protein
MDWLDIAILALRVALVVLLYLFIAFVVRGSVRALRAEPERATEAKLEARPETAAALLARSATQLGGALRLLVLEAGETDLRPGQMVVVADGATLGRADQAGLVLADPAVSAEHARLTRGNGAWAVIDLGSTNGTLVNQRLVEGRAALEPGDVLGLGNVRLKVVGR